MLNAKLISQYNKDGMIYVYNVTGPKPEVDQYVLDKENQGYKVTDSETGNVLLWSRKLVPGIVPVATDGNGNYFLDNSYDKAVDTMIATSSPAEAAEIARIRAHEKLEALKATFRSMPQRSNIKTDVPNVVSEEETVAENSGADLNN